MVGEYGKYAEGLLVESLKLLRDLQLTEASGLCCCSIFHLHLRHQFMGRSSARLCMLTCLVGEEKTY